MKNLSKEKKMGDKKFKVGDRVKIAVDNCGYECLSKGNTGTVVGLEEESDIRATIDKIKHNPFDGFYFKEHELRSSDKAPGGEEVVSPALAQKLTETAPESLTTSPDDIVIMPTTPATPIGAAEDIPGKQKKGKLHWSFLCYDALEEIVKVREFAVNKYGSSTAWENVPKEDWLEAGLRHYTAYLKGEEKDNETGLNHMAHVLCNAMFYLSKKLKEEN